MNVSMNGIRRHLSTAYIELLQLFEEKPSEDICAKLDELRSIIGGLNCIYDPEDENFAELEIELPWTEEFFNEDSENA